MSDYLTTRELAELLRIKERKVYDLASSGAIPCSRALGKLLFPRHAVEAWIAGNDLALIAAGPPETAAPDRPKVILGSHDPLLEWALRDARSGVATFFDGSLDGLDRFAAGEGIAAGLHIYEPASESWNINTVQARFARQRVVLVEWAWRERGLIMAPERGKGSARQEGLAHLRGKRLMPRQPEAGSQILLDHLLREAGIAASDYTLVAACRTETDAALAVLEGRADVAFGLRSLASQFRLGFVPIRSERFDLLIDRRSWFEPPMQALMEFCRSDVFRDRVREFGGYDTNNLGRVVFNGA